jgi:DNA mismatch endonuclease, patch repair protein
MKIGRILGTTPERSRLMAKIRSKNTKPEIIIRKKLFSLGFRYVLHSRKLNGHPDIVLPRWHTVIFVNGCFWHRHRCSLSRLPKSNQLFWLEKLNKNCERDIENIGKLLQDNWRVAEIWECAIRGKALEKRLISVIEILVDWIHDSHAKPLLEVTETGSWETDSVFDRRI